MGKLGERVSGKFERRQQHSEAFEELKNMLSSDTVQAYFDPQAEHKLYIDGCPVGLAATLTQRKPGEQCWKVVQYTSRSLKDPEKRYSQIELEALAGDFGCNKFHPFLYGRPLKMVTDHKPLKSVFNKPTYRTPQAVTRDQVKGATDADRALQALKRCINQGWIDTNDANTQPFRQVFHELSITDGIALRGDR